MKVTRKTTESRIVAELTDGPLAADYREKIDTGIAFVNHMIEHIAWRSNFNLAVSVCLEKFCLAHVVAEDAGQTVGRAIGAFYEQNQMAGMTGYGDGIGIIDEAKASCAISFESRSLFCFSSAVPLTEKTEDMQTEDLRVFLDGLCQGAGITMHLDILKGENSHHVWEAAFRAVGIALGRALYLDAARVGKTAGVAGKIAYEIN